MDYTQVALEKHKEWRGKIETALRTNVDSADALSIAYTPGVAAPCLEIQKDVDKSYIYTRRWNTVAVVTDGTAVTMLAALINALKVVGKKIEDISIVTSGAGAAGIAIIRLLMAMGLKNVILTDRKGAIYEGRDGLNPIKEEMAKITNLERRAGSLADVIKGADVFIGVSAPGMLTQDMVRSMAKDPIVFACANPVPEIYPDEAKAAGAAVIATGRSDYPNQVNNVLCFPGIFRAAMDVRASDINDAMKIAAAKAIAGLVTEDKLCAEYILPTAFDPRLKDAVAAAVAQAARDSGVARI